MKKIRWKRSEYISDVTRVLMGSLWTFFTFLKAQSNKPDIALLYSIFMYLCILILLIWFYSLVHRVIIPELEVTGETFMFHNKRDRWKKRTIIPVNEIENIIESTRSNNEFGKSINMPTFIIKTKSGKEYEFFPNEKQGKRFNEIIKLLKSFPMFLQIKNEVTTSQL